MDANSKKHTRIATVQVCALRHLSEILCGDRPTSDAVRQVYWYTAQPGVYVA